MFNLLQAPVDISGDGFQGIGPLGLEGISPSNAPIIFAQVISNIIGFITIIAGIWFIFQVLIAGFAWMTAGGDKAKLEQARGKLGTAVIGLGIVAFGVILARLIALLLGLEDIFDIVSMLNLIRP